MTGDMPLPLDAIDAASFYVGRAVLLIGASTAATFLVTGGLWMMTRRWLNSCKAWTLFVQFILDRGRRAQDPRQ